MEPRDSFLNDPACQRIAGAFERLIDGDLTQMREAVLAARLVWDKAAAEEFITPSLTKKSA